MSVKSSSDVAALYGRFPYPPPEWSFPPERRELILPYVPEGTRRLLDAGCGTGAVASQLALALPDTEVVAIDLTARSLELAGKRYGHIDNLSFQQADLQQSLQHLGSFDLIVSFGVLHHLPEPRLGLANLCELATDRTRFLLFLYALYGRLDIERIRNAFLLVSNEEDSDDEQLQLVADLRRVIQEPKQRRLRRFIKNLLGIRKGAQQTVDADQYLNPIAHHYTIATLLELLEGCGLVLDEFLPGYPGNLIDDPSLLPTDRLVGRASRITPRDRWALLELVQRPTNFTFVASRQG